MGIFANLIGTWTDITNGTVEDNQDPVIFFKEHLRYKGDSKTAECFEYGYINIQYDGHNYRINPSCIQIVT